MTSLLEVKSLAFRYQRKLVLSEISFALEDGEVVAIIGPSGAGKSTLLRVLALLAHPCQGDILFRGNHVWSQAGVPDNTHVSQYRRSVGVVFQELYLWPHLNLLQNITLPLIKGQGLTEGQANTIARGLLDRLSIEHIAEEYPRSLSVGQQQRCAIARTLAMNPALLLLDEITSALDPELVASILGLIREIAAEANRTLLVVTHEMDFAMQVSDRIGYMEGGRLIWIGKPSDLCALGTEARIRRFLDLERGGRNHGATP